MEVSLAADGALHTRMLRGTAVVVKDLLKFSRMSGQGGGMVLVYFWQSPPANKGRFNPNSEVGSTPAPGVAGRAPRPAICA